ncbi:hypothetical protein ACOME3_000755 [Neoechinorhynchus agilis]
MMPTTLTHFCDQLIRFKSSVAVMSSDAKKLCCAGFTDNSIRIYNTINGRLMESVKGHTDFYRNHVIFVSIVAECGLDANEIILWASWFPVKICCLANVENSFRSATEKKGENCLII